MATLSITIARAGRYDDMKRKAYKQFAKLRLDNVRYKGKPTPSSWQRYEVY